MNRIITYIKIALFCLCVSTVANGNEQAHLDYDVPKDAEVTKKSIVWGGNKGRSYYRRGSDRLDKNALLAKEVFSKGVMVERKLYFEGKRHGLHKKWYENKQLKSEIPYKNGLHEGWCSHWNSDGKLVGKYLMKDGAGEKVIFDNEGILKRRKSYINGMAHGSAMGFSENGNPSYWITYDKGGTEGVGFSFWDDGSLKGVSSTMRQGAIHGIAVSYRADGQLDKFLYFVGGMKTTKEKYLAAREKDKSLIYLDDPQAYKKLFSGEMKTAYVAYKKVEPVKIPLELDVSGNPLSKKGEPVILPTFK